MSLLPLLIHWVVCWDSQCLMTYLQRREAVVRIALNVVHCHLDFVGLFDGSERFSLCTLSRFVITNLPHVCRCRCSVFLCSIPSCLPPSLTLSLSLSLWNSCTIKPLSDANIVYFAKVIKLCFFREVWRRKLPSCFLNDNFVRYWRTFNVLFWCSSSFCI